MRHFSGKRLLGLVYLSFWLVVGTAGVGLANVVPEECTLAQQVISSDPELRALCLQGSVEGRIPDTSTPSGSTGTFPGWLVVAGVGGAVALAGMAGALLRRSRSAASGPQPERTVGRPRQS